MKFNINKYDNITFSEHELTHKRIKVLLLWFEYEVYTKNISLPSQIPMMTNWINRLESQEYYEVLPFFTNKRDEMIIESKTVIVKEEKIIKEADKVTVEIVVEPFLIRLKTKINKIIKKIGL